MDVLKSALRWGKDEWETLVEFWTALGPSDLFEHVRFSADRLMDVSVGFFKAIRWSEPFIVSLLCFHAGWFRFVIWARRRSRFLAVLFFVTCGLVAMSKPLNRLGQRTWFHFATQNYFDENGTFVAFLYAFPLLISAHIIMWMGSVQVIRWALRRERLRNRKQALLAAPMHRAS